jgi:hypothetical protein
MKLSLLILPILILALQSCCLLSSSNHMAVIDGGNVNGKRSYYMGSSAHHHHFWVGRQWGQAGSGYEYKIPRERYRVSIVRPYSPYFNEWTSHQSTYVRPVIHHNKVGVSAGYRSTKVHRWSQPIQPRIIEED